MSMLAFPGDIDDPQAHTPALEQRIGRVLVALALLGLLSFAAVWGLRATHNDEPSQKCGPFTIGESEIGGCDRLGQ